MRSRYVVVDGNIGSGKSTLLAELSKTYPVLPEPVDVWCSPVAHRGETYAPPLERFYMDPVSTALEFQLKVFSTRLRQLSLRRGGGGLVVIERDPFDKALFPENAVASGQMRATEHEAFCAAVDEVRRAFDFDVCGKIYIDTDPATCVERIAGRSREAEAGVDFALIRRLHSLHEEKYSEPHGVPVARIDGGKTSEECAADAARFLRTLL